MTSTRNTSTSALLDPQYCRYICSVAVASAGLLMYSTVLLVFSAHSSATALVQRPLSPTRSESPANRTVSLKTTLSRQSCEKTTKPAKNRTAIRPKELFTRFMGRTPFIPVINHSKRLLVSAFYEGDTGPKTNRE